MRDLANFFTNSDVTNAPVTAPAFSLTKVGVAAMFLTAALSGIGALAGELADARPAVVAGAFALAGRAVLVAGLIAVADIVVRGLPTIVRAADRGRRVENEGTSS